MNMKHTCTHLPEEARSVNLLHIDGFSVTAATIGDNKDHIKSRCTVDGYDWEIRLYPARLSCDTSYMVGLELAFLGGARTHSATVKATLLGKLADCKSCGDQVKSIATLPLSKSFRSPLDSDLHMYIASGTAGDDVQGSAGSLTVECTISVVRDPEVPEPICLPAFSGRQPSAAAARRAPAE
ncbi:unnamed protein product [Urochloa humidicola]